MQDVDVNKIAICKYTTYIYTERRLGNKREQDEVATNANKGSVRGKKGKKPCTRGFKLPKGFNCMIALASG